MLPVVAKTADKFVEKNGERSPKVKVVVLALGKTNLL